MKIDMIAINNTGNVTLVVNNISFNHVQFNVLPDELQNEVIDHLKRFIVENAPNVPIEYESKYKKH